MLSVLISMTITRTAVPSHAQAEEARTLVFATHGIGVPPISNGTDVEEKHLHFGD